MSASLVLGGVELNDEFGPDEWQFSVLGEDVTFGSPQPVETSIASLMADGSVTVTTRHENREAGFRVTISAFDSGALAAGERELNLQLGRRNTLAWTPADGFGPTSVFDVETSSMDFLFDDVAEAEGRTVLRRTFRLRLVCLPFARSVEVTVEGGEFVGDSLVIDDDCESTTGWDLESGTSTNDVGTFTVDTTPGNYATGTGAVKLVITPNKYRDGSIVGWGTSANYQAIVTKTGLNIDASSGGYLSFRVKSDWDLDVNNLSRNFHVYTSAQGKTPGSLATASLDSDGFYTFSVLMPDYWGTVTGLWAPLAASKGAPYGAQPPNPVYWFDSVGHSDTSGPQGSSLVDVGGSARSESYLSLSALVGLGDAVLYSCPDRGDGFSPNLRRFQVTGTNVTRANSLTGTAINTSSPATLEAPASMFRPGAYAVLARMEAASASSVTLTVSTRTHFSGVGYGPTESITNSVQLPSAGFFIINVGTLNLPPQLVGPGSDATVKFTLSGSGYLDELLVFPLEDAALTWVRCGNFSRLWVDAPSPQNPLPKVLVGNEADRSDARAVQPLSRGRHVLQPGPMLVYALGSSAGTDLQIAYYKRWHSNAAE